MQRESPEPDVDQVGRQHERAEADVAEPLRPRAPTRRTGTEQIAAAGVEERNPEVDGRLVRAVEERAEIRVTRRDRRAEHDLEDADTRPVLVPAHLRPGRGRHARLVGSCGDRHRHHRDRQRDNETPLHV